MVLALAIGAPYRDLNFQFSINLAALLKYYTFAIHLFYRPMTPEDFFELFLEELKVNQEMNHYYKFRSDEKSFHFRKNYFLERLRYIYKHINDPARSVFDCGCGYGTTCFFLAMNGIATYGETLEFYYEQIRKRALYWQQFGDISLFQYGYENFFDKKIIPAQYDTIIVQDTLHHLEPIHDALQRLNILLKKDGKMVVIEENGSNIIQSLKLYRQRGNNRIINIWDEKLQKEITIGNENIRSLKHWSRLMQANGFRVEPDSIQYIRYFLPFRYNGQNQDMLLRKERSIAARSKWKKEYLFFGINFIAGKK